ncbi:MAG: 1-acyl-sn-glycerol-3-phosphate acyltransferase [Succinivibrionaceae bacterium]|nr:1-acyl-sn-glycerol-3-phosphate acyltransferase [Succinivibrionaceae bacterium]
MTIETSEDSRFDNIRPYRDEEVPAAIERIMNDDLVVSKIINFQFKKLSFLSWLLKPIIKRILRRKYGNIKTVAELQKYVAKFLDSMIKNNTDGVVFEGFEKLDPKVGYLFISNHRDISLDPALVDLGLHRHNLPTVRIAIGDNLLRRQVATDLMKLNQSFIVNRSSKGRELLKALADLSDYIRLSLKENHSIWIAQREGRAKDGNDQTDPAILKMFYMAGKKLKIPFNEYVKELNIVPVAISYEFDPGDADKAHELSEKAKNGEYQKSEFEDIDSIVKGISGYKGRIYIKVGDVVNDNFETPDELATYIDGFIHKNYHLFPSNLVAAKIANKVDSPLVDKIEEDKFMERINNIPEPEREFIVNYYANPVVNAKKSK